jgi:hypothetical protein
MADAAETPDPTDIVVQENDCDIMASFLDIAGAGLAVRAQGFTIEEEFRLILQLCKDPDPKIRGPALRHFHTLKMDILKNNGAIGRQRIIAKGQGPGGSEVSIVESRNRLLSQLERSNKNAADRIRQINAIPVHALPVTGSGPISDSAPASQRTPENSG